MAHRRANTHVRRVPRRGVQDVDADLISKQTGHLSMAIIIVPEHRVLHAIRLVRYV